jgi:hypothetical protein
MEKQGNMTPLKVHKSSIMNPKILKLLKSEQIIEKSSFKNGQCQACCPIPLTLVVRKLKQEDYKVKSSPGS